MIWLVDSSEFIDDGRPLFLVREILVYPWDNTEFEDPWDPTLVQQPDACTLDGAPDPTLVVAALADPTKPSTWQAVRAWRIDVEAATFTEIATDGIECVLEME